MNKVKNRLITIVLAVCMVFGTSAMAFAATVSINKTSAVIAVGNTQTLQLKNVKKSGKITVVHARNQQELEELINQIISKSDKLGMSKEDIIKLIDENISKIPPSSTTVISPRTEIKPTLLPSEAIDYKCTTGDIVHLNKMEITSINENDYSKFATSTKTKNDNWYKRYTIHVSVSGNAPSLCGKTIGIVISGIWNVVVVDSSGNFENDFVLHSDELQSKFVLNTMGILGVDME